MASQAVSVDDVRVLKVALGWHEAVALVQEVAGITLARGHMPDPDLIILSPLGELSVQGDLDSPEAPPRALAGLLNSLLGGPGIPPNLRQLVADTLADAPLHGTVESFTKALMFFERPNRRADIAAVCTRTATAASQMRSEIELERIRARRSSAVASPKAAKRKALPFKWPSGRAVKTAAAVAAAVVVLGVVSVAVARIFDQPPAVAAEGREGVQNALASARLSLTQFAQAGLSAVGIQTSLTPPPAASEVDAAAATVSKPGARPRAQRAADASGGTVAAVDLTLRLDPAEPASAPATVVLEGPRPLEVDEWLDVPVEKEEYTAGDAGVEAAELIRPQIPSLQPEGGVAEEVGVLDLLVDANGAVTQVRLLSPTNRFQERMLVSAAKAWRFRPATKDGQPVPYRLRVRITI